MKNLNKDKYTCKYCGKVIHSICSLKNHEKHFCKQNPNRDLNFGSRRDWPCKYCNYVGISRRDLQQHIKDNHYDVRYDEHGKRITWNKGLTKETDERVANNAKAVQQSMKLLYQNGYVNPTQTDEYWTEERRNARSEQKKKLYQEHPEKHPNRKLAGNRKRMTYPEQLVFDWLTQNQIQFIHSYYFISPEIKRYVDFYIPAKNLFIEIDGEHWHPLGNEHDKLKDEIATKHGYKTLRIRYPSMHVTNTLTNYFNSLS